MAQDNDQNVTLNEDNRSGGKYFEGPTQIYGDFITDSIVYITKPNVWISTLKEWNESIFRWSNASAYHRSSWATMTLYGLSSLERIHPKFVFQTLTTIGLWILTAWLFAPLLVCPLVYQAALLCNVITYSIATLLIPLLVGLLTVPDQIEADHITTSKQQWQLQLLKCTGASVGFWVFAIIIIAFALVAYYLGQPLTSYSTRAGIALLPLLFSYIVARTMPAGRLKMFDGEFKLHPADRFFCIVTLFIGPAFAIFLYAISDIFNDKFQGPIMILVACLVAAFWAYKKRSDHELSDPVAILFLGVIIPIGIIGVALIYTYSTSLSALEWLYLGLVVIYFLSETTLAATLLIRKQIKITQRGLIGLLCFFILINVILVINALVYQTNLWPTLITVIMLIILWEVWGLKRFSHHAQTHPSIWLMQASLGTSLYLVFKNAIPLWINASSALIVTTLLIGWAYGRNEEAVRS